MVTSTVTLVRDRVGGLRPRFSGQLGAAHLSADDHAGISTLLVAAFPEHSDIFRDASWYGARSDHRLWLEEPGGILAAHLDFELRVISVGVREVLVAGVGEVAVHPARQGRGLGRRLMSGLRRVLMTETPSDFGYLGCREEVIGFYERVGWHRIHHKIREVDPESGQWTVSGGPTMILPADAPLSGWPKEGVINLRGMWW